MDRMRIFLTSFGDWWGWLISAIVGGLTLITTLLGLKLTLWPKWKESIIARQRATIKDQSETFVRLVIEGKLKSDAITFLEDKIKTLEKELISQHREQLDDAIHHSPDPRRPTS